MNGAKIKGPLRKKLWAECARNATYLENITVAKNGIPPFKQFRNEDTKRIKYLRTFGEIGVAKDHAKIVNKMENKGKYIMFLGYPDLHSDDTYRALNLSTMKIAHSRDT